jgi:hypothetical protein
MMRRTALILKLSILLSALIFVADQVLHYTMKTALISQATNVDEVSAFGRGLTETCLLMNRETNGWLPCSEDFSLNITQFQAEQNSILFLQHGTSKVSSVELINIDEIHDNFSALLIAQDVSANTDYRASTIGVYAKCSPITSRCAMSPTGDPLEDYTRFNCSENFWGVLNKPPLQTTNASAVDPDVPPLAFKWSRNLQSVISSNRA